jgi:hypothetical protein
MQENNNEPWRELWEKASFEADAQKRLAMTNELNKLFLEEERKISAKDEPRSR